MSRAEEIWRNKSDEDLRAAADSLLEYTEDGEKIIRAELRRRGMPEPAPIVRSVAEELEERSTGTTVVYLYGLAIATGSVLGIFGNVWSCMRRVSVNPSIPTPTEADSAAASGQAVGETMVYILFGIFGLWLARGLCTGTRPAVGVLALSAALSVLGLAVFIGLWIRGETSFLWLVGATAGALALYVPPLASAYRNWDRFE